MRVVIDWLIDWLIENGTQNTMKTVLYAKISDLFMEVVVTESNAAIEILLFYNLADFVEIGLAEI